MIYSPEMNSSADMFTPKNADHLGLNQQVPSAPNGLTNEVMASCPEMFDHRSDMDKSIIASQFVKSEKYKASVSRARKLSDAITSKQPKK